jgi:4'-phosphopantetheinyl transferase
MLLPALDRNNVNVFILKDSKVFDAPLINNWYQYLSQDEKNKYHKFYFEKDKRLYLLSHTMLRLVISQYLGCSTKALKFGSNKYGKPYLLDYPECHFNLSHSKQAVALVVNQGLDLSLGVDIECFHDRGETLNLATNYFSQAECVLLNSYAYSDRNEIFFKLWTLKESYIKAIGKGLSINLNSFSFKDLDKNIKVSHYANEANNFWRFSQKKIYDEYFLALAIRCSNDKLKNLIVNTIEYKP